MEELKFVKDLVEAQLRAIKESDGGAGELAYGLLLNQSFNDVVYNLFYPMYLKTFKDEIRSDPDHYVISQLEGIVNKIEEAMKNSEPDKPNKN